MLFFHDKISNLSIKWNERPLTEADFHRLCKRFKIKVEEYPLKTNGFYYSVLGGHYIVVDSRLTGFKKLFVMFHELAHFLLHTPDRGVTANFHGVGRKTRKEIEADAFALCALIPRNWIETRSADEIAVEEGIDAEIILQRFEIYERHDM